MSIQSTGSGFVAACDCGWRTTSQTRRVVEQRLREHEEECEK
ncbi:MAG TPA: hypothetical protein VFJ14_06750 [Nocardioidaceae bacterium]|nr:hypothetical protein [Nocardioidaceae bacterium]